MRRILDTIPRVIRRQAPEEGILTDITTTETGRLSGRAAKALADQGYTVGDLTDEQRARALAAAEQASALRGGDLVEWIITGVVTHSDSEEVARIELTPEQLARRT